MGPTRVPTHLIKQKLKSNTKWNGISKHLKRKLQQYENNWKLKSTNTNSNGNSKSQNKAPANTKSAGISNIPIPGYLVWTNIILPSTTIALQKKKLTSPVTGISPLPHLPLVESAPVPAKGPLLENDEPCCSPRETSPLQSTGDSQSNISY